MKNDKDYQKLNNEAPLVSVIMPVFNASKYLVGALDSIVNQAYSNWELIAVDDASTDDSFLILNQYSKLDSRIKVYKNAKNLGVSKTSNYAISKSKGEYIVKMDADDLSYPERIENQINFLINNPEYVVVGGQVKLMTEEGKFMRNKNFPTKHQEIYEMMYTAMSVQQGAMMVNTKLLPNGFEWYNGVRTAEEVKLFFRLFNYGKFANLSSYVLKYRQYDTSTSLKNAKETFTITYKTRKIAEKKYGYKPSKKSKMISEIQNIIVKIIPNKWVYPAFIVLRSIHLPKVNINVAINSKDAHILKKSKKQIFVYN